MSTMVTQDALREPVAADHFVRFYDDDSVLLAEVAEFIAAATMGGGVGIVIATAEHLVELRRNIAVAHAAHGGADLRPDRLILHDAEQTLAKLLVDGWPDETKFYRVVGGIIGAAGAGPVRVFGEMVALLCAQGQYRAAIRVEELWNELSVTASFSLFCAYPWSLFPTSELGQDFANVCSVHKHVCRHDQLPVSEQFAAEQVRLAKVEQGARALGTEVARRKEAEEAVRRKDQQFADFMENAAEGLHQVGGDGIILWANKAELSMLGYGWHEYVGRHIAEFHLDAQRITHILDSLKAGATLHDQPARLRCKDGSVKHVLISSNGYFENGKLRYTRCVTRDATDRYERDLARAQRDQMLLQAPVATALLTGSSFIFHLANSRFCQMFSCSAPEGRAFLEVLPQARDGEIWQELQTCFVTGRPFSAEELPFPGTGTDGTHGEERFLKFSLEPLTSVDGEIQGIIVVAVDVSEHVRCRLKLEQARLEREVLLAQLTKANRAKDEFLAMLGHELRNPLAPIVTALELMRMRATEHTPPEEKIIRRQVEHLVRLVDDLLDISRITSGKIQLKMQKVEVSKFLGKAVEMVSPLLEQRKHLLSMEMAPDLHVRGDIVRLTQALSNLLTNAARYTDPGGHIRLSVRQEMDNFVRISVADNGIGIPEPLLTQVFDIFFQSKQGADRRDGGLGIGLALVKNIVELHGGSVYARSPGPGQGSEFVVRLPVANTMELQHHQPSDAFPVASGRKLRILLVDDNIDAAETLGQFLTAHDHAVRVFNDPVLALAAFEAFKPHIVVLDIGLPVLNGYELVDRMRSLQRGFPCKFLTLTGYGQDADKSRSKLAGIERHLVKPVDARALLCFVNEISMELPDLPKVAD